MPGRFTWTINHNAPVPTSGIGGNMTMDTEKHNTAMQEKDASFDHDELPPYSNGTRDRESSTSSELDEKVFSSNENITTDDDRSIELAVVPMNGGHHAKSLSLRDLENGIGTHQVQIVMDKQDDTPTQVSGFTRCVARVEIAVDRFMSKHSTKIKIGVLLLLLVVYLLYFGYCMSYRFGDEGSLVLLVVTLFMFVKILFKILDRRGIHVGLPKRFYTFAGSNLKLRKIVRYSSYIVVTVVIVVYLAVDVFPQNPTNIQSFFGMVVMVILCFIFSKFPSKVNWHPVFWSFAVQFVLAFFTLRTQIGYDMFKWLGDLIQTFFDFSDAGSEFVIGKEFNSWGLALSSSGVIIFSNAVIFLLNHWGVIEFIVLKLGGFLAFCLETGPVESVVAAANIFISLTEAPLMIRPYLPSITKSEIHTIIACGMSSTSGGIMGLFMMLGAPPNHLLTAGVISAPAALGISKLVYPETETIMVKSQSEIRLRNEGEQTALSAFADGAVMGVSLCVAAWSNMLAFVSMLHLLDALVGWLGDRAGIDGLSFSIMCSYVFFPLMYAMGVELADCLKAGELLGIKMFSTPFVSYKILGDLIDNREMLDDYKVSYNETSWHWTGGDIFLEATNTTLVGGILTDRAEVILTYAMCGLSAWPAIGMTLGTMVPLCPARKQDIVEVMMRAFVASNVACFATGAIAGVLYTTGNLT